MNHASLLAIDVVGHNKKRKKIYTLHFMLSRRDWSLYCADHIEFSVFFCFIKGDCDKNVEHIIYEYEICLTPTFPLIFSIKSTTMSLEEIGMLMKENSGLMEK